MLVKKEYKVDLPLNKIHALNDPSKHDTITRAYRP